MVVRNNEELRLDALQQLNILDTDPSESFDRITRMASQIFGLPIAAVSLTDRDRQWFKSRVGVDHWQIPRDKAPCAQCAGDGETLVVTDLLADEVYRDSLLASSGVRFYAGAPLITRDGYGLGAMCVLGTEPRQVTADELSALRDLAAMAMAQIELQHAFGRRDPLSGMPNRIQFEEDLADKARDQPDGESRIVLFVDLASPDQVDQATRVLGPTYLDDLVCEAARAIRAAIGPRRKAYQVGASQFALLAPRGVDQAELLTRLNTEIASFHETASSRFVATTVIGVAPFRLGRILPRDILRIAHSAAQHARSSGEQVGLYSAAEDDAHRRRFNLLHDFGAAVGDPAQFRLVYQPRIDLPSGRCVGAEALMRWTHPALGTISPAEFIPIIERTTLARATTDWVIGTALDQLVAWRAKGMDIQLSVNISAANLREPDFVERTRSKLAQRGLPSGCLELEVTESAVMDDATHAIRQLQALADAGISLAVDDFGTGYSSLSYLQQLPVRVVKIDRSFVGSCATDERERSLVAAMVSLSHDLGYRVVAEGVETEEIVAVLEGIGCDEAQGYHYARPLEAADMLAWFSRRAEALPRAA
jgi:EAL domain-containing protein (putative c-di-GMP-specific phosphodiesterase class I)/GAF domain-containing protein